MRNRTERLQSLYDKAVVVSREKSRERELERDYDDDLIGFVRDNKQTKTNKLLCTGEFFLNFSPFFFQFICFIIFSTKGLLKTNRERARERERNDDADFVNPDFKNDDSDDEKNDRGSSKSSFLLLRAEESKRDDGFLLLLLEIVLEKKDDDDFLIIIVQKCRRDGRAKAL